MTLERRTRALVDLIEDDRATRCATIAADACARAQNALRDAHRKAREDMRVTFAEERARAADALASANARLATHRRHAEQRRAAALLDAGLARLPSALARHWRDDAARARWIDAAVTGCIEVLASKAWEIAHPVDWASAEQGGVRARVAGATGVPPRLVPDARVAAGLRVAAGGIVVDSSDAGLVADRAAVGARLLGLLESTRAPEPAHG